MSEPQQPLSLVVLISGRGSNLKAILDAIAHEALPVTVQAVISSNAHATGLEYARRARIDILALDAADYPDREQYDQALRGLVDRFAPDLVALAGFMRILTPAFVNHYRGRLINIHPSLLPAFRGLHTHQRALDAGVAQHGASVHFVTEELDGGPVVLQAATPVNADDDAHSLAARVLQLEHRLYCQAIRWIAEGRVSWGEEHLLFDGQPMHKPQLLNAETGD